MQIEEKPKGSRKKRTLQTRRLKIYSLVAAIILLFLIIANVVNLVSSDKTCSESENRVLAQKPTFSLDNLLSGKFMTDTEDYVADQFFWRDGWMGLKLFEDLALGKRESGGVYIGKNQTLLQIPETPDEEELQRNLDAIADFSNRHSDINTVMALVPDAAFVCDQLLPANAPVRDEAADISHVQQTLGDAVQYVDLCDQLRAHKDEYIYYKTDHHWTSLGARYVFEALAESLGITNPASSYDIYPVTTTFSGTLSSKSGYHAARDTIEIYIPQNMDTSCVVNYIEEERKTASIYDSSALEQKDQYEVFMGGNFSRVDISSPKTYEKNLLLIKDSYANCLVQFLLPYYRNIILIDPRYYYEDLDLLIEDNNITDILFLYNFNTFMTDHLVADVLEPEQAGGEESSVSEDSAESSAPEDSAQSLASEETTESSASP